MVLAAQNRAVVQRHEFFWATINPKVDQADQPIPKIVAKQKLTGSG